eukprot:3130535-Amphidinium_carterae.2
MCKHCKVSCTAALLADIYEPKVYANAPLVTCSSYVPLAKDQIYGRSCNFGLLGLLDIDTRRA